ncbi:MAG: hypothetical protein ACI9SE_001254 [Neolewinella sp.]
MTERLSWLQRVVPAQCFSNPLHLDAMNDLLRRAVLALTIPLFLVIASCGSNVPSTVRTAPEPAQVQTKNQDPKLAPVTKPTPTKAHLQDAPHLFLQLDGSVQARWVTDGMLQTREFAKGEPIVLKGWAHLLGESLQIGVPTPPKCKWDAPTKMLALSDVEGEYDSLLKFLTSNQVVDDNGHWAFGKGHLVGVGDMVDRGDQVTEVLWLFYRLSLEAKAAGGHVHFVLGNHEAMMMGGDVRYTNQKYFHVATLLGVTCEGLVGADTVIGRWLRSQNCIERVGDYVFVHAGLSPQVVRKALDYDGINAKVRSVLGVRPETLTDVATAQLSWGRAGPLWYRGYFPQHAMEFGPTPGNNQFGVILKACDAKHIVVGHTKVARVATMYEGGLIPIDVPWTDPVNVRGLLVRGDKSSLVDMDGASFELR